MNTRYFIELAYKGTKYFGWQIQPNSVSVQAELTKCISILLAEEISITGAGRTDTGVHARFFIAHFDSKQHDLDQQENLIFKCNRFLSPDISIYKIYKVKHDAHARFDAISRTYEYHISRIKNPFLTEYSHYVYGKIDVKKMNEAADILFEYEDFTSFSKLHTDTKTNLCKIIYAKWEERDDSLLVFKIRANRFLRNMVRAITGTLLDVGLGKLSIQDFRNIIEAKNRCEAGSSMPAKA
ncbi:MAG: tRNA pseudouridine(38-40) synthase TruA, partial [Bacteroidetes bacterium RIFOXYA2_FULL_33_7]